MDGMRQKHYPILQAYMRAVLRFAPIIIIAVILITVYFAFQMKDLELDTEIGSYMNDAPPSQFVDTPVEVALANAEMRPIRETIAKKFQTVKKQESEAPAPSEGATKVDNETEAASEISESQNADTPEVVDTGYGDGYVILFTSDQMYTKEVLNLIYRVRAELDPREELGACLSPFDFVTVEKHGSRLAIVPMAPVKDGEVWTDEDVAVFKERLMNDSIARNYLYSADGNTIMMFYDARWLNAEALAEMDEIIDPLREYGRISLNGGGLINNRVTYYIKKDLATLLILCFLVILLSFFLSFRTKRSLLLPSSLSIISIIWTLGLMAKLGYDLTIVTILTPCLVLTFGSSYSIHIISEYFHAIKSGDKDQLSSSLAMIIKTILSSAMTTVLGFLSLLICRTEIFRDFGITVSFGIAICALLSITYLPAVLALSPPPSTKRISSVEKGLINKRVSKWADAITRIWPLFLILPILITIVFFAVKDKIGFDSNYMSYFPQNDPLVQDSHFFAQTMGGTDPYYLTINAPNMEKGFFLKSENLKSVYAYEQRVAAECPDIVQILSFSQYVSFLNSVYSNTEGIPDSNGLINLLSRTLRQISNNIGFNVMYMLINDDASQLTLSMRNYDSVEQDLQTTASARRIENTLDRNRYLLPSGTSSKIWCMASDGLRASDMILEDQEKSTILSLALIFIVAIVTFLSLPLSLYALLPVAIGIMINYIFMYIAKIPFDIVTVGFTSVTVGAGVDDALHFLLRYHKHIKGSKSTKEAVTTTLKETGRPIILTTLSVDGGLMMLAFASYTPIRYFGIMMCVSLTAAMLATLFILPPVVIGLSHIRAWIRGRFDREKKA